MNGPMPLTGKRTQCVLFDWGGTLMREFPEAQGPMALWPRVEALPFVRETLETLHSDWLLGLATNAADSDGPQIVEALRRVELDRSIDEIFCARRIGAHKPSAVYFDAVVSALGLPRNQIVMVGDDYEKDVLGARRAGLHALWFSEGGQSREEEAEDWVLRDFRCLPELLKRIIGGSTEAESL